MKEPCSVCWRIQKDWKELIIGNNVTECLGNQPLKRLYFFPILLKTLPVMVYNQEFSVLELVLKFTSNPSTNQKERAITIQPQWGYSVAHLLEMSDLTIIILSHNMSFILLYSTYILWFFHKFRRVCETVSQNSRHDILEQWACVSQKIISIRKNMTCEV